jgi:tetratricopeptide (TPR) repeat protein
VFAARGDSVSPHYGASANLYLAEALVEDGELERARAPMAAAVVLYRDKVEDVLLRTLAQVIEARYLSECGDYEGSNRVLEATREDYLRLVGADHPHTASVVNRIGVNHLRMEHYELARAAFESILGSEDQVEDVWGSMKHLAQRNLAIVQLETGDVWSALPALQRHLASYHAAGASARNAMSEAALNLNLGRAYLQDGQPLEALPLLRRGVEILVPTYPKSPGLALNRSWLGLCLLTLGDDAEARDLARTARATFAAQPSTGIHYRRALALLEERLAARPGATT